MQVRVAPNAVGGERAETALFAVFVRSTAWVGRLGICPRLSPHHTTSQARYSLSTNRTAICSECETAYRYLPCCTIDQRPSCMTASSPTTKTSRNARLPISGIDCPCEESRMSAILQWTFRRLGAGGYHWAHRVAARYIHRQGVRGPV
jgi:hypothetical protein